VSSVMFASRVDRASAAEAVWEVLVGEDRPHDGSGASSRGSIQVVVEFKLEVDPDSKPTTWL
jgi:hypothetical protein